MIDRFLSHWDKINQLRARDVDDINGYLLLINFMIYILETFCFSAYSSSFAEMGLAIDEHIRTSEIDDCNYDELQLSPAHQVLISCIWTSLKVQIPAFEHYIKTNYYREYIIISRNL